MNPDTLRDLLTSLHNGKTSVEAAIKRLRSMPFENLEFAKTDTHRHLRCGFPEVIFCQGKTAAQVITIAKNLYTQHDRVLATRAEPSIYKAFKKRFPNAIYHPEARTITLRRKKTTAKGLVLILCAGTADIPVAEEARVTAEMMDCKVEAHYDIGVAGIHRLLGRTQRLQEAKVLVVVAGMEGALASVVGGLVSRPVIAVPTSVGYGASFGGIAPLLTMLNSCAAGVSVVNIDNGFGAGYIAALINHSESHETRESRNG